MEKLNQALQAIFYLVWIFLGIVLLAGVVYFMAANPFAQMSEYMQSLQEGPGSFGQFGPPQGQQQKGSGQSGMMQEFGPPEGQEGNFQKPPLENEGSQFQPPPTGQ